MSKQFHKNNYLDFTCILSRDAVIYLCRDGVENHPQPVRDPERLESIARFK